MRCWRSVPEAAGVAPVLPALTAPAVPAPNWLALPLPVESVPRSRLVMVVVLRLSWTLMPLCTGSDCCADTDIADKRPRQNPASLRAIRIARHCCPPAQDHNTCVRHALRRPAENAFIVFLRIPRGGL